jgi:hypothetical protein
MRRRYIYDDLSPSSSQNEKVSEKRCREKQNSRFMFNSVSSGSRAVYEVMWQQKAGEGQAIH